MLIIGLSKPDKKEQELFIQNEYYYYPLEIQADFIGSVPNDLSYIEFMESLRQQKIKQLEAIEHIMLEDGYQEKRLELQHNMEKYIQKKNDLMQKVRDYEATESERLGNEMAPIEEFNALYQHIDEMFMEIATSQEYQENEAFLSSLKADSVLYNSLNYYLSDDERGEVKNDDFHYGMIENFDYVIVDDHSYIISEAIEETKCQKISNNKEFDELYKYLKKPVKKFGPVIVGRTDDQNIEIIKEVPYKELKIDDLCHLSKNEGILVK